MALMQLGVKKGAEVVITAEGADEEAAIAKLEAFMKENL
jgi:phosphocarrier protein